MRIQNRALTLFLIAAALTFCCVTYAQSEPNLIIYQVGLSKVDITPSFPIRLSGFSSRKTESEGVRQKIFARALAIRGQGEPIVLIAVESIGISPELRDEVTKRLQTTRKIAPDRVAFCSTHSHTAPTLRGVLPTMFGEPLTPAQQQHVDQYTDELIQKVERAAVDALDNLVPSTISFGIGQAGFAQNRRTPGGPVDHQLPVLVITGPDGKVRGIYLGYACHCVLLRDNLVSGDWAGAASDQLEQKFPGSVALVSIGCGADSNPATDPQQDQAQVAAQHGREIVDEVGRLLADKKLTPVHGEIECQLEMLPLPLQPIAPRDKWVERSQIPGPEGYYARVQLERIDGGETLPTEVPYPIQTWKFGKSLAMVFLGGEVVVDYAIRLKKELGADRLWVTAYANSAPAYIPSERILKEGGYEGGQAMQYYALPALFAPGLEDRIIAAISKQLGPTYKPISGK